MPKVVMCPICGLQFETVKPNKKYCSFSCKEAGHKLQRMKWETQNPDYIKQYMKQYRTKEADNIQKQISGGTDDKK